MSEQTSQDELYSTPVTILDKYTCLSLGATTINDLVSSGRLAGASVRKNLGKRPDVLIVDKNKHAVVFMEFKQPEDLGTAKRVEAAIDQEIEVAREVNADIYVVTDGSLFIWINPKTGNRIVDSDGNELRYAIRPKEEQKKLADFIELVVYSISETNDTLLTIEELDPTDLAVKIAGILKRMTFTTSKMALYTFVEVFLFKYLSDIGILRGENSFSHIAGLYDRKSNPDITTADILGKYLEGPRSQMSGLFPPGPDGTSIVNGKIFHATKDVKTGHYIDEDSHAICFQQVISEFVKYERKNGKFISISKDFKSKLFETFMKNREDKSDMGQFFTPLKVVKEMVRMVHVFDGAKICDPAAGVGKFLLEAEASFGADYVVERDRHGNPVELRTNLQLYGFEKQMSGNDDITTILAKANMLIYFSKLFRQNNDPDSVMLLADQLLNRTFVSSKTALGSLERDDRDAYDLILANPPYYQDATISRQARSTGRYTKGGQGIEGLFLEWIIRALKPGGVANVVLPDGIFTNSKNAELKEYMVQSCFIESIISLPINSFFNTPKKTYILTLRKKTKQEAEEGAVQRHRVFAYLCSSIGESLDTYRFDIPENDLHEAVNKYSHYRELKATEPLEEPFASWFASDRRLKLIDPSWFKPDKNWNIDNCWTDDEKVALGIKSQATTMSIEEFDAFLDDMLDEMASLKEVLQCAQK